MRNLMPVLFVSHGAPTLLIDGTKAERFFRDVVKDFPRPKGILVISGHWEEREFTVSTVKKQETIYDFYGFPQELYEYKYEPDGDVVLAEKTAKLLESGGLKVGRAERGLDHGAWVPLICMYPEADIPVTQLSLKMGESGDELLKVGELLRPLREEGYLILASGSATHNLRDFGRFGKHSGGVDYAVKFDEWLARVSADRDFSALADFRQKGPFANVNHPTDDHFTPFLIAAGASEAGAVKVHDEFVFGMLSLAAYRWDG